ncbi:MAG: hypothetical protein Q4G03_02360, partial [Planctomycetia bacterium]|nr:hypothetical protein [Planctomycetia bacterium]
VEARLLFLGRKKRPWAVALFLSLACCPPLGALASYYFARVFTSIMKQDVATAAFYLEETRKTLRGVAVLVFIAMCLFLLRLALIDVYEG